MSLLEKIDKDPCQIVRELVNHGYETYIVGGAVRDLLLGSIPKDYDICTSATPEEVRAVFGRRRCRIIGRRFRLAHVIVTGEIYEVSTFRRMPTEEERRGRYDDDGKMIWNDNYYGTLEQDASRRDFTVNALYFDVAGDRNVIDFNNGLTDLADRLVRVIGDPFIRFEEDPVRMLRALKLCGRYKFDLGPKVEKAIRKLGDKLLLVSTSRLFEELLKILHSSKSLPVLEACRRYDFLQYFWPTVNESWDEQEGKLMRTLLNLRCRHISQGDYSTSKALGMATVCLPFVMSALNPENISGFWKRNEKSDILITKIIHLIFERFNVPKVFTVRIREMIQLVPILLARPLSQKALRHREYKYGRLLVELLVEGFHWSPGLLSELPLPDPEKTCLDADEDHPGAPAPVRRKHRRRRKPAGRKPLSLPSASPEDD